MQPTPSSIVTPRDPTLSAALRLALAFAAFKLALHIVATLYAQHLGYSYFRDEFYYLVCGRRLAWGYVDHGPLVALQARLSTTLFGASVLGIRLLSHLAGAAAVFLTGLLAWALGGRRSAQSLAMLALLCAPEYLALDSFLSMNSVEPVLWMLCTLALILITRVPHARTLEHGSQLQSHGSSQNPPHGSSQIPRLWILFGISAGLGLLNKPSMTFFLIALGIGLLLTPQRRILFTRWTAVAIALLTLIALPKLLWQIHHGWPALEFLRNGKAQHKNIDLPLLPFLNAQVLMMHPLNALLWITGLVALLRARSIPHSRWIAYTYLIFFALMFKLHAKDYYLAPIYPVLFAAGAITWQHRFARPSPLSARQDPRQGDRQDTWQNARPRALPDARPHPQQDRIFAFPIYGTTLILSTLVILPMALPILSPPTWIRYTAAQHLHSPATEHHQTSALPQFYADRFGWQQEVDLVNRAYISLSPEDRARVTIFASNYGEAGAIDILGARQHLGLPPAISGHNTYWLWGPGIRGVDLVIAVVHDTPERLHQKYASVTVIGHMDNPLAMPFEHKTVYLLRNRLPSAPFNWSDEKDYI